jgi:hypothetical protein
MSSATALSGHSGASQDLVGPVVDRLLGGRPVIALVNEPGLDCKPIVTAITDVLEAQLTRIVFVEENAVRRRGPVISALDQMAEAAEQESDELTGGGPVDRASIVNRGLKMLTRHPSGEKRRLLVLESAHVYPPEMLDQLARLTGIGPPERRMQLLLVGDPLFWHTLQAPKFEEARLRIGVPFLALPSVGAAASAASPAPPPAPARRVQHARRAALAAVVLLGAIGTVAAYQADTVVRGSMDRLSDATLHQVWSLLSLLPGGTSPALNAERDQSALPVAESPTQSADRPDASGNAQPTTSGANVEIIAPAYAEAGTPDPATPGSGTIAMRPGAMVELLNEGPAVAALASSAPPPAVSSPTPTVSELALASVARRLLERRHPPESVDISLVPRSDTVASTDAPATPVAPAIPAPAAEGPQPPVALHASPASSARSLPNQPSPQSLLERGDRMMALSDVSAARLLYGRAAALGSSRAAVSMGRSFDPIVLSMIRARIPPDPAAAAEWYRRAAALGSTEATAMLARLEAREPK